MIRRLFVLLGTLALTVPLHALQPSGGQLSEFVPVEEIPQTEQLPAAAFLVAAYAFFLVAVLFYLWTIWRRLGKVEAELTALERRQSSRHGS